jgi:hypothetical protein
MRELNMKIRITTLFFALTALACVPSAFAAEAVSALSENKGFATIKEILDARCSACHDWTGSYDSIIAAGRVVPGKPESSRLYQKIASDEMPADGDKLTPDQKAFIKGWIAAGAPSTELALSVPADTSNAAASPEASKGFLFFPSKVAFHEATGFASTALFFAAGIVGGIHFIDMMSAAHGSGIFASEGLGDESVDSGDVIEVWNSDQALRWVHVGLLVAGEALYIGDAITGVSMFTDSTPGKLTKHDIHRYAFFTHAALMVSEVVLGFLTTDALSRGDHNGLHAIAIGHTVVGLAIPVVMLGAGLENMLLPE